MDLRPRSDAGSGGALTNLNPDDANPGRGSVTSRREPDADCDINSDVDSGPWCYRADEHDCAESAHDWQTHESDMHRENRTRIYGFNLAICQIIVDDDFDEEKITDLQKLRTRL